MTNEDTCESCGKEPVSGVMLLIAFVSLFWLGAGFLLGQQFSNYHQGYTKAAADYTQACIEIHQEECK